MSEQTKSMSNDVTPINENTWHLRDVDAVLRALDVDPKVGLSGTAVTDRRTQYGTNEIQEGEQRNVLAMIADQFKEVMVLVLIAAAAISLILGEWIDATVILAIVVVNAILGFVQEYRAEQAMEALREMASPNVKVRRGGQVASVPAKELVPGDVVLVEAGDAITADSRIIESADLRVMEASLTGESEPISKNITPLSGDNIPLGDRKNMIYMGTAANYGRGVAVVTNTGMQTELGNIATLIQNVEKEETPLQRRMAQLGRTLTLVVGVIIALVIVLNLINVSLGGEVTGHGGEAATGYADILKESFLTAVALAVAAIPEGLPAIVTIALALGAQRMLSRDALIRKLPAVETLGSVTTICSDKTGTLTQNKMTVQVVDMADETITLTGQKEDGIPVFEVTAGKKDLPTIEMTLITSALCNDAILQPDPEHPGAYQTIGDPTEAALLVAAEAYGLKKKELDEAFPRIAEIPFSSDRKRMTTINRIEDDQLADVDEELTKLLANTEHDYMAFTKGGLDVLLPLCKDIWVHNHFEPIEDWLGKIEDANKGMAERGLRVLGICFRPFADLPDDINEAESNLTFVGLTGMMDPPRPEVEQAVKEALTAGIRPVMITGDHPITAKEIAKQLNIAKDGDRVVTGRELAEMSMSDLENIVEEVPVFARVSPEHKLNIVQALQNKGHVVAMTGDGVNDAPALRKSDIGVAMGITGTDVSKEAADMVLLDDNFATIVGAVKEGRTIYDNIRKFLQYILTSNSAEIYVMLFPTLLALLFSWLLPESWNLRGMGLPLVPLQILWINLVTDGLPGLALSVEPSERDVMTRAPFSPTESIFSRGIGKRIVWAGLLMGIVSFAIGLWGYLERPEDTLWWRTLIFNTLTMAQMGNALAIRSNRESIFKQGLRSNMMMVYAVISTFLLQLAVIYVPFLQNIFQTTALTFSELILTLVLSTVVFWAIEAEKLFKRS